jgi:hypothetical protein
MEEKDTRPARRVGTLTMGVTLVAAGAVMLAALFFPQLDLKWTLRLAPLALIGIGAETLFAARSGAHVKYDWASMLICFLVVCAALCMFAVAWLTLNYPNTVGIYFR